MIISERVGCMVAWFLWCISVSVYFVIFLDELGSVACGSMIFHENMRGLRLFWESPQVTHWKGQKSDKKNPEKLGMLISEHVRVKDSL